MNKRILFILAAGVAFSLAALAYTSRNNAAADQESDASNSSALADAIPVSAGTDETELDLNYSVGSRWSTRTKQELEQIERISQLLSDGPALLRDSYRNVWVAVLHNDRDVRDIKISAVGQSEKFNDAQLELLRSCDYSTNLRITARNRRSDATHGVFDENDSIVIYMTVVPEKQAAFVGGFEALVDYLKAGSEDHVTVIEQNQLQPGKVFFTVTREGKIDHVKLVATSGYDSVDKALVEIVSDMPEMWAPAENGKGEKVDQEFVFSFGAVGC